MAGAVALTALLVGAAALVGGSGSPRDDGGDDEVAVPDSQDLQQANASTGTTPPRVHCVRDDVPVACVRWIRHPAEDGPGGGLRSAWPVRVASESVVTVEHDTVRVLSRGSGEVQWDRVFDGPLQRWHLVGDVVVLSTSDGRVHALSTDDGTELWSADGVRPVATHRGETDAVHVVDVRRHPPVLTARAPRDGRVEWEYELPEREDALGSFGWPDAIRAGSLTFLTMDARRHIDLVALDSQDGTERWRRRDSRLVHASDGVAVVVEIERTVEEEGEDQSHVSESLTALVGVDARDGAERWRYELPGTHPVIGLVDDVMVVADEVGMTALDVVTGEERWGADGQEGEHLANIGPWWWGAPESRLTGVLLSVVPRDSLVIARDIGTGEQLWRTALDRPVGEVMALNGAVVVRTTQDSYVQLDPASGAVLGTVTVEGPEPVRFIAADVLVDPRSGWLVAIDLPQPR